MTTSLTLSILTVPATTVGVGFTQVTATTRATKGKTIEAAQRSRSVIVPDWTPNVETKYKALVWGALYEAAKDQLSALWKESDPKECDGALFAEDSLIAFAARQAESKRLNSEAIEAWYAESEIRAAMLASGGEKQAANVLARLVNLASPEPKYTEQQANAAIVALENDSGTEMGFALIQKLNRIIQKINAEKAKVAEVTPF